jgi:hypothetical protein
VTERGTYPPLDTLKPAADEVWIVDGPVIRFGLPWPKVPFPTRMTVIRLASRRLLVHSPTPLSPALRDEIADIGEPAFIVAPNRIHYWWVPQWSQAYPEAIVYLAPRVREQAKGCIDFPARELADLAEYPWDAEVATLAVAGDYLTEYEFFHRASGTLVLTDLIENFEAEKLGSLWMRWLTRLGGVQHPDGGMPRDLRVTFVRHQADLKHAVATMIAWRPQRIIIAHGRWFERDGTAELERAFRWVL